MCFQQTGPIKSSTLMVAFHYFYTQISPHSENTSVIIYILFQSIYFSFNLICSVQLLNHFFFILFYCVRCGPTLISPLSTNGSISAAINLAFINLMYKSSHNKKEKEKKSVTGIEKAFTQVGMNNIACQNSVLYLLPINSIALNFRGENFVFGGITLSIFK